MNLYLKREHNNRQISPNTIIVNDFQVKTRCYLLKFVVKSVCKCVPANGVLCSKTLRVMKNGLLNGEVTGKNVTGNVKGF